jgi:hypothetical protein
MKFHFERLSPIRRNFFSRVIVVVLVLFSLFFTSSRRCQVRAQQNETLKRFYQRMSEENRVVIDQNEPFIFESIYEVDIVCKPPQDYYGVPMSDVSVQFKVDIKITNQTEWSYHPNATSLKLPQAILQEPRFPEEMIYMVLGSFTEGLHERVQAYVAPLLVGHVNGTWNISRTTMST